MRSVFIAILALVILSGPADAGIGAKRIDGVSGINGTFDVIFFGARHLDDPETIAILDIDDGYEIVPRSPKFDYKTEKAIASKDAIDKSLKFIKNHTSYMGHYIRAILDEKGKAIGYEIRPLYRPLTYGETDVLDIGYALNKSGKVFVIIRLKPAVEEQLRGGDGDRKRKGF